jgi:long-chain acyl-CoA synthetase
VHLSEIAAARPDKPALIMSGSGRVTTYAELDRASLRVAGLLNRLGVVPGEHVALILANRPEYLEIVWGMQRAGTYWTPVNWHLTEHEAGYVVADCDARVLFASEPTRQLAGRIAERVPNLVVATVSDYANGPDEPSAETEGSYFFYSSGTTGMPKGIKPKHDFPPFGTGLRLDHLIGTAFGFDPDTVYLCPAPLYHSAPVGWSLVTQRHGGTVVVMERFDALDCLRAIEEHRVTHAQFVPTHFVRMLKLPEEQRRAFDLSSLRVVVHASAPCPVEVKRAMIDWLGPKVIEYYAGSESNGMTTIGSADWLSHPGSVGRASMGTVHILGADGGELPPGEIGTIYFADGGTFTYHNDPAKTAAAHNERGWSTLGDLGRLDADGYLYLADRRTDLIISGGVNVYPAEVEAVLITHPSVLDVAVIGLPDPELGQKVVAVVQPAGEPDPAELIDHCRTRLAHFKCPKEIRITAELPRLPTGKLLRRVVREGINN